MPFLTVAGQRIHHVHRQPVPDPSPPVLFMHGAGGTHQHWLYQVRDLPHSTSLALDLPGHGRSQGSGMDSILAYADWMVAFMDAAGMDDAVLVGHSMGGAIALELALRHPARVKGLGLVATGARLRVAPAILDGILKEPGKTVGLICKWAFGPETPEETIRLGQRQMSTTPPEVLYGDFAACNVFDARDRLAAISCPAFVLCGTQDRMTPAKYSAFLGDAIDGATLHLVEGAGHMIMIERPQAVLQALTVFLQKL